MRRGRAAFISDRLLIGLGVVVVVFLTLWRLPALRSQVVV